MSSTNLLSCCYLGCIDEFGKHAVDSLSNTSSLKNKCNNICCVCISLQHGQNEVLCYNVSAAVCEQILLVCALDTSVNLRSKLLMYL